MKNSIETIVTVKEPGWGGGGGGRDGDDFQHGLQMTNDKFRLNFSRCATVT